MELAPNQATFLMSPLSIGGCHIVVQKKQPRVLIRLLGQQIYHEMYLKSTKPESSPAHLHVHAHM